MMRRPLDRPAIQALVLAASTGLFGLVLNAARVDGLPLGKPVLAASGETGGATCEVPVAEAVEIDIAAARTLHQSGAAFVDARQAGAYAVGHVPGALHLPSRGEAPDADEIIARLRGASTVVIYDDDASCELARRLGERLVEAGMTDVRVMVGGFAGWQDAGEPAQSGLCEACDRVAEGKP